jgi:hypothetical protein
VGSAVVAPQCFVSTSVIVAWFAAGSRGGGFHPNLPQVAKMRANDIFDSGEIQRMSTRVGAILRCGRLGACSIFILAASPRLEAWNAGWCWCLCCDVAVVASGDSVHRALGS